VLNHVKRVDLVEGARGEIEAPRVHDAQAMRHRVRDRFGIDVDTDRRGSKATHLARHESSAATNLENPIAAPRLKKSVHSAEVALDLDRTVQKGISARTIVHLHAALLVVVSSQRVATPTIGSARCDAPFH
jgi:hypothetical protein